MTVRTVKRRKWWSVETEKGGATKPCPTVTDVALGRWIRATFFWLVGPTAATLPACSLAANDLVTIWPLIFWFITGNATPN